MCKKRWFHLFPITALILILMAMLTSCGQSSTEPILSANYDSAQSIAASLAYNTGGIVGQLSDLSTYLIPDSKQALQTVNHDKGSVISYNNDTGFWNILLTREIGIDGTHSYANIVRNYNLQYLNATGEVQKYYITNSDTARTVIFNVVSGSGQHITRNISQELNSLTGSWIVTKANQDSVVVNGTYNLIAHDTITGDNSTRIFANNLSLELMNVVIPRGYNNFYYSTVTGNISGSFNATVTFSDGDTYAETTVHRDTNINLGTGIAVNDIGNRVYRSNLLSGELVN